MILSVSKMVSMLCLTIVELWLDDSGRVWVDILKDKSELIFFFIHVGCLRNGHSIIFKSFKSHCAHCFDFMTHSFTTVTLTPVFSNCFWRACAVLKRGSGKSIFVMYAGPENRQLIMTYMFITLFIRHKNKLKIEWITDFITKTEVKLSQVIFFFCSHALLDLHVFVMTPAHVAGVVIVNVFVQLQAFPSYSLNMQKIFWPKNILKKNWHHSASKFGDMLISVCCELKYAA